MRLAMLKWSHGAMAVYVATIGLAVYSIHKARAAESRSVITQKIVDVGICNGLKKRTGVPQSVRWSSGKCLQVLLSEAMARRGPGARGIPGLLGANGPRGP